MTERGDRASKTARHRMRVHPPVTRRTIVTSHRGERRNSYNELTLNQSEDLDPVSGQAWLNGFPVRVEALGTDTRKTDPVNARNN
jgi:hypothetical protein